MKECPLCRWSYADNQNYCAADGKKLEPVEKCDCGEFHHKHQKHCTNCGKKR